MILELLGWLAVADAVGAAVFVWLVYAIGRRKGQDVKVGSALGLAILLGLPASMLYLVVWLFLRLT